MTEIDRDRRPGADRVREEIADYLNGEWPNCFSDGFQYAVAGALIEAFGEHLTFADRLLAACKDIESDDGGWNGGDVVDIVLGMLKDAGLDVDGKR